MFLSDKSSTTSLPHITNEMQNPKRNEKKQNLKSFTNKKDSAKREEKAMDTERTLNEAPHTIIADITFLFMYCKVLLYMYQVVYLGRIEQAVHININHAYIG